MEVVHDDATYRGVAVQVPDLEGVRWLRHYTAAGRGSFSVLEGRVAASRSVWTSASNGTHRRSSLVSERLGPDRWRRTMSVSDDGGTTWRVLWMDELERVPDPSGTR